MWESWAISDVAIRISTAKLLKYDGKSKQTDESNIPFPGASIMLFKWRFWWAVVLSRRKVSVKFDDDSSVEHISCNFRMKNSHLYNVWRRPSGVLHLFFNKTRRKQKNSIFFLTLYCFPLADQLFTISNKFVAPKQDIKNIAVRRLTILISLKFLLSLANGSGNTCNFEI